MGSAFANAQIKGLTQCLIDGTGLPANTKATVGNCFKPAQEADATPAKFVLVPAGSKLELRAGFRNGSFERGKIGWLGSGDARVLSSFGGYQPTDGGKVGIISTGLGYTDSSGAFNQSFCVPEGTKTLALDWNYISAEFMTYCNTEFQDTLRVSLVDLEGSETVLLERTVDSLCGSVGPSAANIPQEGDPDGTYATGWQTSTFDVSSFAGTNKDVRLVLSAADVGDSIYDTAILLDSIKLQK